MDEPFELYDTESWEIDFPTQTIRHDSGLIVQVSPDALYEDKWSGRCLNAREWSEKDFTARARHIPLLLRAALTAYEAAHKKASRKDL